MNFRRSAQVDCDARGLFEAGLKAGDGQKAGVRGGIDEEVEIAAVAVVAMQNGAEDARVSHARFQQKLADGFAVLLKALRRSHKWLSGLARLHFTAEGAGGADRD